MLIYIKHGWHSPFQLTAARRRLVVIFFFQKKRLKFQLTAARRRLVKNSKYNFITNCFNSQPPEGGWRRESKYH